MKRCKIRERGGVFKKRFTISNSQHTHQLQALAFFLLKEHKSS